MKQFNIDRSLLQEQHNVLVRLKQDRPPHSDDAELLEGLIEMCDHLLIGSALRIPEPGHDPDLMKYTVIAQYNGEQTLYIQDIEIEMNPELADDGDAISDAVNSKAYEEIIKKNGWDKDGKTGEAWADETEIQFLCVLACYGEKASDVVWRCDGL